jgi:UPF0176 protein
MSFIHSSFYRFSPVSDPSALAAWLRTKAAGLGGVLLVAEEGLSAAIAGEVDAVQAFEGELNALPGFAGLHFKHNACERRPFSRLKVSVKREIVAFGIPGVRGDATDTHVSPQRWRELLADPETVVLDNRNTFEFKPTSATSRLMSRRTVMSGGARRSRCIAPAASAARRRRRGCRRKA